VRNAKFNSCFLASGDRLDEANLRHLHSALRGNIGVLGLYGVLWCFRGNIGVLGLNRALEGYLG